MTEIVISIAAKVAENLVNPTIRLGQYLFCANNTTKRLLQKKDELVLEKDRIQRRIDQALNKTEIIEDDVMTWMNDVTNALQEAVRLEGEMEANKCCYQTWCPTWRRYHLCKQMAEKINIMTDLKNNSQFDPFSHLAPLPGIEYESSKDFTFFESTKLAYNKLFEALRDGSTSIIGLYGMGGCGKTTLVTEVGKRAKELKLFDLVLSVTVSQTPDIRSIQGTMADMLGLKMGEESIQGRAQRLSLRLKEKQLKEEQSVLIIVDDVWRKFNLKDIGIEFNEGNKGRHKVLLTTRRLPVCSLMDCGQKIPLGLLSEEEAWKLFRNFAAMDGQSYSNIIEHVAREVVGECTGLPIAIKAVASSLKGKLNDFQFHEWKVALQKLKDSKPIDVEEGERDAFSCLKLSYDYLRDKEAELLFFMCAMFPEDYQIPVEDLIRYGVGHGVGGEIKSFDLARSMIQASLNKLLDSCLLEETYKITSFTEHFGIDYVKMHDLVRDLALWMASKEDLAIRLNLVEHVNSLVGERDVEDCFTISSQYRKFQETDHQLDAPKLEVLILNTVKPLHLSYASIEGMKGLKVLAIINLSNSMISLLPQSIGGLSNLRTLRLRGWELGDMSFIASLRRLEVLVLQWCRFKEVPDEIEKLSKLKLLDLTDCQIEENYSLKTIERCSQLEELYVFGDASKIFWQCCAHFATAPNLQRYRLKKGRQFFDFEYIATEPFAKRMLCLERLDDLPMLGSCKNIVPDMEQVVGGLGDLTELCLKSCSEIEYLIDTTSELGGSFQENAMLDRLIKLELKRMGNLKEVCHGAPPAEFFRSLKELRINRCQQLHNIFPLQCNLCNLKILKICSISIFDNGTSCAAVGLFSMSVAQSLQQLEELRVERCPELRHIIANVGAGDTHSRREEISPALRNCHLMFPSLKELGVFRCPKLEFIFPISCVGQDGLVQLEVIQVSVCDEMKYVFGQYDYGYNPSHENKIQIMLPHLQVFELESLINLLGICPNKYHTRWPSLRKLSWRNCSKLAIPGINLEQSNDKTEVDHPKPLTTKFHAPETSVIFFSPTSSFQYLQSLVLDGLSTLKFIFSMVVLRSLSELKFLSIHKCDELVEIIADDDEHADLTQVEVCLPKLEELTIRWCSKLKSLFCLNTVIKEEIVLPNLSLIQLEELPNFVDICQGFMIHKLKLQEIEIRSCPKFVPILGATQVIPFHHRTEEKVTVWDITVNQLDRQEMLPPALQAFLNLENLALRGESGVEGILHLQVGNKNAGQSSLNSNLQRLDLTKLPELRFIWGGNITVLEFHRLDYVSVNDCPKLKTIFPSGIVGSLQSLEKLYIWECEELEEIIASSHLQQICFPKLKIISIKKCDKLKCIFSDYMPRHFPQLFDVEIEECCEIERIFGGTRVADEDDSVVLIRDDLILRRLPKFAEIGHGIQLRMKPDTYVVDECPRYTCQFI